MASAQEPVERIEIIGTASDTESLSLGKWLSERLSPTVSLRVEYWPHLHDRALEMTRVLASTLQLMKSDYRRTVEEAERRYHSLLENQWSPFYHETRAALQRDIGTQNEPAMREILEEVERFVESLKEKSPLQNEYSRSSAHEPHVRRLNDAVPVIDISLQNVLDREVPNDLVSQIEDETALWLRGNLPDTPEVLLRIFNNDSAFVTKHRVLRKSLSRSK
jgi:hypothetical protein